MKTMATTSESVDKSMASKVFKCGKDKVPVHNPDAVIATSADTGLRYGQPGEKSVGKGFWHCQRPY